MKNNLQLSPDNPDQPRVLLQRVCRPNGVLEAAGLMALALFVLPLSAQTDPNALPALAPAYGELSPTFLEQHQTTLILAGLAMLTVVGGVLKVRSRPPAPVVLAPADQARQALAALQQQPEDGKVLSAVSRILRRYLSERFKLPNGELTTAEFCARLEADPHIGANLAEPLAGFLRECDVRKFSPARSATPLAAAARALELLAKAEGGRAP